MTVSLNITPTIRPFRGFADPALPDGYWASHGGLLGDASAGLMLINIRVSTSAQPNPSTLWSLEQLAIDRSPDVAAIEVRLDYGGFDIQPLQGSSGSLTKLIRIRLEPMDVGRVAISNNNSVRLPLFLGAARGTLNVDLAFGANNLDGSSFSVFAQGFFWGPGAINAPGGPQRPLNSIYGN